MSKASEYPGHKRQESMNPTQFLKNNYILFIFGGILLIALVFLIGFSRQFLGQEKPEAAPPATTLTATNTPTLLTASTQAPVVTVTKPAPGASATPTVNPAPTGTPTPERPFFEGPIVYGHSFNGAPLYVYRLGSGPSARAIIGGIHGGYEWNTVHLVSDTLQYLQQHPDEVPKNVTLYVIPNMNPDGYAAGTDPIIARMNGNGVDLNRNWDYHWQMTATHGTRPVKAGTRAFSEPETAFTRDFIHENEIELVIFYHSALGVIFSGAERDKAPTYELAEMLSDATGYAHQTEGVPGQITTGDAIDYLSKVHIAGAEIELTTHDAIDPQEKERNLRGVLAFLNWDIPNDITPPPTPTLTRDMTYITHTVQLGETLWGILFDYGLDVENIEEIMYLNGLPDEDDIQAGDNLLIPISVDDE